MISEYLRSLEGIEVFGVAGLILSILLFIVVVIWAIRADRAYIRTMERLPLDTSNATVEHSEKVYS